MNYLGHSWIALKSTNRNDGLLIAGSHIPDLVPFVPNSVFSFDEIHESGDLLLDYLRKNHPESTSFALGIMSHSVKFGADQFNSQIDQMLKLDEVTTNELGRLIADASHLSYEKGKVNRLHNFLWTGVELYLSQDKHFLEELSVLNREVDTNEVSQLLSGFFDKDFKKVNQEVNYFLGKTKKISTNEFELAQQWADVAVGLPEKDRVNVEKTAKLIKIIYTRFADRWQEVLNQVLSTVKTNMTPFLAFPSCHELA